MSEPDYCDLCDLPWSTCIHGNPPAPPPPAAARVSTPRASPVTRRKATSTPTSTSQPARAVPRKWTPPDAFKPDILEVLREHGGSLEQDDLFAALETAVGERLTTADHDKTPEGELRWRYAARRARQALVADGIMTKGQPGVWSLAD
ncbi:hypothetical protein [Nocardioides sp. URHA0020]|uniref:hypothetical protein n=1 Tax=Nocardioides sp. URHA0020 TaxID=1380392 RepID=UPI00048C0D96|nr:hypothetical protein [Nocardioides sp. URHA0020]